MKAGTNGSRVAAAKGVAFSKSPVLAVRLPDWRSRVVLFVLFAAFLALAGRALWLQGVSNQFLQKQGASRYERTLELPATRGKIFDRNGIVLASSLPVKAVWAIPEDVLNSPRPKLRELAQLLELPEADLLKKLDSDRTFVYLKRQVEMDVIAKIEKLGIDGLDTRKEYKRYYPQGEVMAHIVGFTNVEDVGQEGIELAQQKNLVGQTGSRRVIKDRLGRIVEDVGLSREPHDGKDLTLAVDSKLQYIAFNSIKEAVEKFHAKAGAAVVLDVHTGEVLALTNWPTYNPNDRSRLTGEQLRNRVITDTFEPGSTLKPFTVALALDKALIKPTTLFDTGNGRYQTGGHTIRDTHPHGVIDVTTIIQKSSNIGTTKISELLSAQEMWEMFTKVGFGRPRASLQIVADRRQGQHVVRPGHLDVAAAARACLADLRARRRCHPAVVPEGDRQAGRPAGHLGEDRGPGAHDGGIGGEPAGYGVAGPGGRLPRRRQDRYGAESHQRPLLADALRRQLRRHRADVEPALRHRRDDRRSVRTVPHRRRGRGADVRGAGGECATGRQRAARLHGHRHHHSGTSFRGE
jgi:hypothetical protein